MENVIYREQQKTYLIVVLAFIFVAAGLVVFVLSPSQIITLQTKFILLIVALVDLTLFWSFSKLTITVTTECIQIAFGIFRKKIQLKDIKDCLIEDYQKSRYMGYGIRFGRDKSVGYVARGGRGIRLVMEGKDHFFSSESPEPLVALLKQQMTQQKQVTDEKEPSQKPKEPSNNQNQK